MRHLKSGRALGVKSAHRRAMMRNLVTSVLEHQRITTTVARAKELRGPLDRMITLGKKGDLTARRNALTFVKSKAAMSNLFGDFAERYAERAGGFSRIIRLGPRRGDGAEMAVVQLVDAPNDPFAASSKPKAGGRGKKRKVVDEVIEEVSAKAEEKAAVAETETETLQPAEPGGEAEPVTAEAAATEAETAGGPPKKKPARAAKGKSAKTPKTAKAKAAKPPAD